MMMTDQSSQYSLPSEDSAVEFGMNFDELSMDIDDIWKIIDEDPDPSLPSMPEVFMPNDMGQGYSDLERASFSGGQFLGHIGVSPSSNSEASDSRTGVSDGSSDSAGNSNVDGGKLEFQLGIDSPVHSFCGNLTERRPGQDNDWSTHKDNLSRCTSSNVQQERLLLSQSTIENKLRTSETLAAEETSSIEVAASPNDEPYAGFSLCQSSDTLPESWDKFPQTFHADSFSKPAALNNLDFEMLSHNDKMLNIMDGQLDHTTGIADSDTMAYENWTRTGEGVQQVPECYMTANFGVGELSAYRSGGIQTSLNNGILSSRLRDSNKVQKMFPQPLPFSGSSFLIQNHQLHRRNDKNELIGGADIPTVSGLSNSFVPAPATAFSSTDFMVYPKVENDILQYDRSSHHLDNFKKASLEKIILVPQDHHTDVKGRELPVSLSSTSMKKQFSCAMLEKGQKHSSLKFTGSRLSTTTHRGA
ncbi:uncharacterized protein LOC107819811 isoform X2 [Nicotiana tabacum]|uniref:Uncharacterized protein LOC107819811 isoform X2 n=3 Tax=Nicotiana TaxID=4085 RepID=A0A1S4CKM5_TOBAC|nr:PREDICTED: uncharacterized protein LOC107819811 isoform X2 [Nicotiana tabacum]